MKVTVLKPGNRKMSFNFIHLIQNCRPDKFDIKQLIYNQITISKKFTQYGANVNCLKRMNFTFERSNSEYYF